MRILVAEDERITRASLTRQLEKWGHEVVATEDGEAAWSAFETCAFDIVLTDWEMPRLSGVELIQRIRDRTRDAAYVYLIMLTGRNAKADIVSGIEAGADDFLSKPFDREELRVRLLAGERVVRLERTLSRQNDDLRAAGERMRRDLEAAARVQQAMLPKVAVEVANIRTAFLCVPTDELAGDALGLHLLDGRYVVAYVVDVTGHGVPAALHAVSVMHALSPAGDGVATLRRTVGADAMPRPSVVVTELNRRFCAGDNAGRFLTMLLCVLDTKTGVLRFARAGHPLPVIVRDGVVLSVDQEAGLPLGIVDDGEYADVEVQLAPGDRVYVYTDGVIEQLNTSGEEQFGEGRLDETLLGMTEPDASGRLALLVDALAAWAGRRSFADDVSVIALDWARA